MKVAYYSPLPPSRSGIADYSELLLPALRQKIDVEIARPGRFRRTPKVDVALYHVGNDPEAHGWIVEALRRRPGVVVLHELVLHHLVAGHHAGPRRRGGLPGRHGGRARPGGRLLAYGVLDNRIPPLWETRPQDFPLAGEILRLAQGLVVHSRYVEDGARAAGYEGPIARIRHPAWTREGRDDDRRQAPIGCFGHVNESKRIPQLYAAFERLRGRLPDAHLLLVGGASRRLADLEPPEGVTREGYVDEERLWSLMESCDIVVSLRSPTMGETSGTVVRALSIGKPLVVSDVGWFSELPDSVAVKVAADEHEEETLAAELERLLADAGARRAMSAAARELATTEHESSGSPISTSRRSRRRRRARRARRRPHAKSRMPPPMSASAPTIPRRRSWRPASARPSLAKPSGPRPGVGLACGHRHRLHARPLRVRSRHGGALDHGRRAHRLRARQRASPTPGASSSAVRRLRRTASSTRRSSRRRGRSSSRCRRRTRRRRRSTRSSCHSRPCLRTSSPAACSPSRLPS